MTPTKSSTTPPKRAASGEAGGPPPKAMANMTRRIEADEDHARKLESSAERIDAVIGELRERNLERAGRVLSRLDRSGAPLKHALRELADGRSRTLLLRALRREREVEVERLIGSPALRWEKKLSKSRRVGAGLDERVVEVPLAVELMAPSEGGRVLDAGAALNQPAIRSRLAGRASFVHFTQSGSAEPAELEDDRFSYLFGDLRDLPFQDGWFDRIVCISTLEHVGMDNKRYGGPVEDAPETWRGAVSELVRVLAHRGRAMLTVPFGRARGLGWYRVFGEADVEELTEALRPLASEVRYFACDGGWFDAEPERIAELDDDDRVIRGLAVVRATAKAA